MTLSFFGLVVITDAFHKLVSICKNDSNAKKKLNQSFCMMRNHEISYCERFFYLCFISSFEWVLIQAALTTGDKWLKNSRKIAYSVANLCNKILARCVASVCVLLMHSHSLYWFAQKQWAIRMRMTWWHPNILSTWDVFVCACTRINVCNCSWSVRVHWYIPSLPHSTYTIDLMRVNL